MEFKSFKEVLALHERFSDTFQKRMDSLRKELPKSTDALIAAKKAEIKQAKAAAHEAERTRNDAVKRFDAVIAERRADVDRLTREITEIESAGKAPKRVARKPK